MKACDYLVDERYEAEINCFYNPIFSGEGVQIIRTWHSGGSLSTFQVGDKLPLKTLYYEYPENFCIVLNPIFNKFELALVENGTFSGFIIDALDAPEEIRSFYTFKGFKIKAENGREIKSYIDNYREELEKENGTGDFASLTAKWIEPLTPEQQLGELVDCYLWAKRHKDDEEFSENPNYHEEILLSIKEFAEEHPNAFTSFITKKQIQF
ncbi:MULTISPECIES: hypothetical protein [Bacillus cereus group]|uniref:Uncharacterized protein n=1 Tax=Bacillus thuringiensis TaxID=1428 RepID=A0A9X6WGQ8_BACTU|nr:MULTISPECIES: hypothetical protein [Bacillus cereus group]PFJ29065.1 hypothetical protein COJ15_32900 [Bacillus thuringiensis]PGP14672.1 hypothetical protein COA01_30430 [Bacillus cereus]